MPTILCIDDDPRILELHSAVLGGRRYTVLTALDGLTGLTLSRNHSIDAIVLDSTKVSMDGNAVAQILMKEQPKLPVVVWSGCVDEIPESLKWYADALLEKTDGPEVLISTIEKLVNTGISRKKTVVRRTFTVGEPLVA
jgi:two-component system, OmpR family, alkaline phosphatase synthesis response regulator PhoP